MRFVFTMTDEMYADLKRLSEKRRTTMAELVRGLLADGIIGETEHTEDDYRLQIGGKRSKEEND